MIKQERIEINGKLFIRTYSDAGYKIEQVETGVIYDEAVDCLDRYHYKETDKLIDEKEV